MSAHLLRAETAHVAGNCFAIWELRDRTSAKATERKSEPRSATPLVADAPNVA